MIFPCCLCICRCHVTLLVGGARLQLHAECIVMLQTYLNKHNSRHCLQNTTVIPDIQTSLIHNIQFLNTIPNAEKSIINVKQKKTDQDDMFVNVLFWSEAQVKYSLHQFPSTFCKGSVCNNYNGLFICILLTMLSVKSIRLPTQWYVGFVF